MISSKIDVNPEIDLTHFIAISVFLDPHVENKKIYINSQLSKSDYCAFSSDRFCCSHMDGIVTASLITAVPNFHFTSTQYSPLNPKKHIFM